MLACQKSLSLGSSLCDILEKKCIEGGGAPIGFPSKSLRECHDTGVQVKLEVAGPPALISKKSAKNICRDKVAAVKGRFSFVSDRAPLY
jgi:hypothetical protein